jgi:hypothetical protein
LKTLIIIILFFDLCSYSQGTSDCFEEANLIRKEYLENAPQLKIGDNAEHLLNNVDNARQKVVGCKFPYAPFRSTDGRELEYSKIKSDFIYINFNYLFSDYCLGQLDSLVAFKKRSKDKISIVSFFSHSTKEIQYQIDKFHEDVIFVSDAEYYTSKFDLKAGRPTNYVLDKNKIIIYAGGAIPNEIEIRKLIK